MGPIGPQGPQGEQGIQGPPGPKGEDGNAAGQGDQGSQGEQGPTGTQGEEGPAGPQGDQGPQGETGMQGEQGEQGPAGQQGEQGEQGPKGVDGDDGQDGNANVFGSEWIPLCPNNISNCQVFAIEDSRISQEIVDSGLVLAFGRAIGDDVEAISLPFVFGDVSYYFNLLEDKILFRAVAIGDKAFGGNLLSHIRYVVIPSGTFGKTSNIEFGKMSYQEVIDHFGMLY
jgi:hypothetical protein